MICWWKCKENIFTDPPFLFVLDVWETFQNCIQGGSGKKGVIWLNRNLILDFPHSSLIHQYYTDSDMLWIFGLCMLSWFCIISNWCLLKNVRLSSVQDWSYPLMYQKKWVHSSHKIWKWYNSATDKTKWTQYRLIFEKTWLCCLR